MAYSVKEIFYTLQGEGFHAGRPAVFCRFTGCNLWSGREQDRATALCRFCDTDFVGIDGSGGGRYATAEALVERIVSRWPERGKHIHPFVVLTGGEPLLQVDPRLVRRLREAGFNVAVETNGTLFLPASVDWLCMSPKAGTEVVLPSGDELKLVYPQEGAEPERFAHLDFEHFFLQPMDGPDREQNTRLALNYCLKNPQWRLSLQRHKLWGIP